MSEHTPTTEFVRSVYVKSREEAFEWGTATQEELADETTNDDERFNWWLAEVERRAAEEAWDTCASDFQQAHGMDSTEPWPYLRDNPYRRNEGEK